MAPPGTRIVVHEKPDQRAIWSPNGVDGWYIGTALDHYRCYRVHVSYTISYRVVDTVEFFTASKDLATIVAQ
jgi:hypothetical protein